MQYGIGYQGSKSGIARDIIAHLPAGNRLVDLFGGGFAISHCALLSHKWKLVLYNDIDPLPGPLIRDGIAGKYAYERFKPEFVSREEFYKRKDSDGYIKFVWSFGNNGNDYIYGKDAEAFKRAGHDWVMHNTPIPGYEVLNEMCDMPCDPAFYSARRKFLNQWAKENTGERFNLQRLQHLECLQHLQNLERLERLERLEMSCMDYREYRHQDGDVVYCDIPYQNCSDGKADYGGIFEFGAFYEWAITQPFPVYFSSYRLGGKFGAVKSVVHFQQQTIPTGGLRFYIAQTTILNRCRGMSS